MADPVTMAIMAGVAGATKAAGTLVGGAYQSAGYDYAGRAAAIQGQNQQNLAYFKAAQDEQQAQESRATMQRQAMEKRREGALLGSKLTARAAASGAGATDPTILALGGNLAGRSEYEALMDTYYGENRARGFEDAATAARLGGDIALDEGRTKQAAYSLQDKAAKTNSYFSAAGTLLDSAGSAFKTYKYPGGSPNWG